MRGIYMCAYKALHEGWDIVYQGLIVKHDLGASTRSRK